MTTSGIRSSRADHATTRASGRHHLSTDAGATAGIDELVTAVLAASRVLIGVSVRSLADVEDTITITQFRTLVVLDTHDGINVNRLADLMGVAPSSTVRMIDRLITAGLVTRNDNPENRREVILGLTTTGRRLVHRVTRRRCAQIAHIVTAMPVEHRDSLVTALQSFAEAADEPPAEASSIENARW